MSLDKGATRRLMGFAIIAFLIPIAGNGQSLDGITFTEEEPGYAKNWALIIGINYTDRGDNSGDGSPLGSADLPVLKNAVKDAESVRDVLQQYYQYDAANVVLLTDAGEDKPTLARIRDEITKLHQVVQPDDSLVVFFAGHGMQTTGSDSPTGSSVALLPCDVVFHQGKPVPTSIIGVPDEFVRMIDAVPSKHKLLILDCCYSGEIFNARGEVSFQPATHVDRSDASLQREEKTFQAMVSCRARQEASDGKLDNSRFTAALLEGLQHLPARNSGDRRVWANRLLAYMQPHFDESQRPDCRSLIRTEGEFCFFPKPAEVFKDFILQPHDVGQLRAMVVSRQGTWWFEEMPWFIPAIRRQVMVDYEASVAQKRSPQYVDLIAPNDLLKAAETAIQNGKLGKNGLARLRFDHAAKLMASNGSDTFQATLEQVEAQLLEALGPLSGDASDGEPLVTRAAGTANPESVIPEDYHCLAVIQHGLGKLDEAERSYEKALASYKQSLKDADKPSRTTRILHALCLADYGQFLLGERQEPELAAVRFADARREVSPHVESEEQSLKENTEHRSAAYFIIFMLCQEADARLAINHWSQANERLETARNYANAYAPGHFLQAHVYRRSAWGEIIQWRIQRAICFFDQSNKILHEQFVREGIGRGETAVVLDPMLAEETSSAIPEPQDSKGAVPSGASVPQCPLVLAKDSLGPAFRRSRDHASKIAYLHNHHGIAMAMRFRGDAPGAAEYYRWLSTEVEDAFSTFSDSSADADLGYQFIDRVVNTQERLGDCNLFGDPEHRDLSEALDDYRRALSRVHLLNKSGHERRRASLLYKQAIVLSLPSSIQDTALAREMCRRADTVYDIEREKAEGLWQALGELTTPLVEVLHAKSHSGADSEELCSRAAALRKCLSSYRDRVGSTPHRDQFELCLFAAKVLVEHVGADEPFQSMEDANLLLSFCRLGLTPFHSHDSAQASVDSFAEFESRAYLRPYYDAVMRAKLATSSPQVKELLEIQAEATQGTPYVKPERRTPCLAIYFLPREAYLLMDLPGGESRCVGLGEMYDTEAIEEASFSTEGQLPLPREISRRLNTWLESQGDQGEPPVIDLRWMDPVRPIYEVSVVIETVSGKPAVERNVVRGRFPFALPAALSQPKVTADVR